MKSKRHVTQLCYIGILCNCLYNPGSIGTSRGTSKETLEPMYCYSTVSLLGLWEANANLDHKLGNNVPKDLKSTGCRNTPSNIYSQSVPASCYLYSVQHCRGSEPNGLQKQALFGVINISKRGSFSFKMFLPGELRKIKAGVYNDLRF